MDMIVERDGKKVKLSDLGVIVKDFIVSSVEFEEHHEDIEGMAGGVDNGVSIGRRSISVPITFESYDLLDFPLLRDKLFDLFHPSGYIYVQEMRRQKTLSYDFVDFGQKPKYEDGTENVLVGGKRYKVRIASPFDFEQFKTYGSTVLEFKTVGLPYSESVYTTKELNDSGYSALVEKYGLVDGINSDNTKYKFTDSNFSIWNAGNVTVGPETMYLKITATGTNGVLEIRNKTTGDTFKVNAAFGGDLVIDGMSTQLNGVNVFRDTNKKFISLSSDKNDFEVIGQFTDITIDFRFYYK